jgi:hypothetical protein
MWFLEGLTTNTETLRNVFFQETRGTSPRSKAIVLAMALEDKLPAYNDLSGYLNYEWPNVLSTYILGGNFFNYLLKTYGLEVIKDLIYAYAVKIIPTFKKSFNSSLGIPLEEVWDEWRSVRKQEALALQADISSDAVNPPTRLTFEGSYKNGIRFVKGRVYTTLRNSTGMKIGLLAVDPETGESSLKGGDLGLSYITGSDGENLYLIMDRDSRTIHYHYYDAYKYNVVTEKLTRLTYDLKVSAFGVVNEEMILCATLFVGRPELFFTSGRNKDPIALDESVMYVNHISVNPNKKEALLSVTYNDGGTDLSILDISTRQMRRITFDRNAKLFPEWIDENRVTYSTPTGTGLFNQIIQDFSNRSAAAGSAAVAAAEHVYKTVQLTNTLGGVYWSHYTEHGLYFMSINSAGYDVYFADIECSPDYRLEASRVQSPAASITVEGNFEERVYIDALNMLDFTRFPYVGIDLTNVRDIDIGAYLRFSGLRHTTIDYLGYYKTLYPYFSNEIALATDSLFIPMWLSFSNNLEVGDPAHIRERIVMTAEINYPFILGLFSALTIGLSQQMQYSRPYRDSAWDPGQLGWVFFPSEYMILDLRSRYSVTATTSIWRNSGFRAAFVFTQPVIDFTGFRPAEYWNNADLHLTLPLFNNNFGVKARLFYGMGIRAVPGEVYSLVSGPSAFLIDRITFFNSVPFRGNGEGLTGQSVFLGSVEVRATILSSTTLNIGLFPVNLNKIGFLLYSDLAVPFTGIFPPDSGGYRLSTGLYLTIELGLMYENFFMDLNFILHYTYGDPRPAFTFSMDFPK